ncbi:MAG TPA: hypothetical protein V6D17_21440, partial [Candidatus Obscuribacterales bacterium]
MDKRRAYDSLRRISGDKRLLAIACVAVLIVTGVLLTRSILIYNNLFGMYHDDGIYDVCAKALSNGSGYRIVSLPGEPWQTKYPIGFPLWLSLFWKLEQQFPANLVLMECFQAFLAVLSMLSVVLYLVATRKVTWALALTIFAACVLNKRFIDFAPMLMSDLPCTCFIGLCFFLAEKLAKGLFKSGGAAALGASIGLAMLVRTQAIVIAAGSFFCLLLRRRFRPALIAMGTAGLFVLPQMMWQASHQNRELTFFSFYTNYMQHAYQTLPGEKQKLDAALAANMNWAGYLQINTYYPFIESIPYQSLPPLVFELIYKLGYAWLGLPLMAGGAYHFFSGQLPALYLWFYSACLFFWPAKLEWRHILPVLPLAYYYYFVGFRFIAKRLKPLFPDREKYAFTCAVLAIIYGSYLTFGAGAESFARFIETGLSPPAKLKTT